MPQERFLKQIYFKTDDHGNPLQKSAEAKQYLLLLYFNDPSGTQKSFEIITGRSSVLEYLLMVIETIDIEKSMILVEGIDILKYQPLWRFLDYCIVNDFIVDEESRNAFENALAEVVKEDEDEPVGEPQSEAINSNIYDESREGNDI